jgi:hypothetical protein
MMGIGLLYGIMEPGAAVIRGWGRYPRRKATGYGLAVYLVLMSFFYFLLFFKFPVSIKYQASNF